MNENTLSILLKFYTRQVFVVVFGLLLCVTATVSIALIWGWGNLFEAGPFIFALYLGMCVPMVSADWTRIMRLLRVLPMSPGRLTLFLVSVSVVNASITAVLVAILFVAIGMSKSLWLVGTVACFALGLSVILLNVTLFFRRGALGMGLFALTLSLTFWGMEAVFMVPLFGLLMVPMLHYQVKFWVKNGSDRSDRLDGSGEIV